MAVYSVVVPLKNEVENLEALIDELEAVMSSLKRPWELVCVDDGSDDGTKEKLAALSKVHPFLMPLYFNQNYGQSSAFDAGFKAARGQYVITMDGDLQNDPRDIPTLLSKIETADLVCGKRINRQDSWSKKIQSKIANFIRKRLCDDGVSDTGCSLKVYRKSCLEKIKMFHGMHRFLPALFRIEGFRVVEVPVNHRERSKGATKYNFFNRSFNTVSDMFAVRWMRKRKLNYQFEKK